MEYSDFEVTEYRLRSGKKNPLVPENPDRKIEHIMGSMADKQSTENRVRAFYQVMPESEDTFVEGLHLQPSTSFNFIQENVGFAPDQLWEEIEKDLKECGNSEDDVSALEGSGVPDFLFWEYSKENIDDIRNYFFCEVKSEGDALRRSQIEWITKFDEIPVRVTYIKELSNGDD